eukprot:2089947-Amphidinium_carterae.1
MFIGSSCCFPGFRFGPQLAEARVKSEGNRTSTIESIGPCGDASKQQCEHCTKPAHCSVSEPHEFAVGDIVVLRKSMGVPSEFQGKVAIVNTLRESHCTVLLLSEDCTHGVAELWPAYKDLEPLNKACRVGGRVVCSDIPPGPGAYLNGLSATVQPHPRDGHPQWPDAQQPPSLAGGRLFVFVVPDAVEGEKRKKPMSVPIRYLRSLDDVTEHSEAAKTEWHAKELLKIAAAVAVHQQELVAS